MVFGSIVISLIVIIAVCVYIIREVSKYKESTTKTKRRKK